jgi:putative transposase
MIPMRRKSTRKSKEVFYTELRTAGGVPLFVQPVINQKLISGLIWCCDKRGLRIYDYTILSDRIVMIANTAWGSLPDLLESYKAFTSKAVMLIFRNGASNLKTSWMLSVLQEYGPSGKPEGIHIWEEELYLQSLFKQDEIDELSVKIQNRAVSLGIVEKPEHYRNCSANPRNPLDGWIVEATDPWS